MHSLIVAALAALSLLVLAASPADARRVDRGSDGAYEVTTTTRKKARRTARYNRPRYAAPVQGRRAGGSRRYATRYVEPRRSGGRRRGARAAYAGGEAIGGGGGSTGIASYYWQGHTTASGARFNPEGMTAAHRTLPFGTRVRVTHLGSGRSVTVTINDRGPFIGGRIIDLSRGAAGVLGMHGQGIANVRVQVIGR